MTTIDDIAARQDLAPTVVPERYLMSAPPFTPTPGPEVELAKLRADVDRLTSALADAEARANNLRDVLTETRIQRDDAEARGRLVTWKDDPGLLEAPLVEWIIAAIKVQYKGGTHWERHMLYIDDDTGEIHSDCYQGWDRDDYTHWMLAPAEPVALAQSPEDAKQEKV